MVCDFFLSQFSLNSSSLDDDFDIAQELSIPRTMSQPPSQDHMAGEREEGAASTSSAKVSETFLEFS